MSDQQGQDRQRPSSSSADSDSESDLPDAFTEEEEQESVSSQIKQRRRRLTKRRPAKKKKNTIISSSSDEESSSSETADEPQHDDNSCKNHLSSIAANLTDHTSQKQNEQQHEKMVESLKKKVLSSGSESHSEDYDGPRAKKRDLVAFSMSDKPPDDSSELVITEVNLRLEDSHDAKKESGKFALDSELFSAGESSSDEDKELGRNNNSLSNFSPIIEKPGTISPASGRNSGISGRRSSTPNDASKSRNNRSSRGLRKKEVVQLQSDVQRMSRERKVAMPKHQPKQLPLDQFLSRKKTVDGAADYKPDLPEQAQKKHLPPGSPLSRTEGFIENWLDNGEIDENNLSHHDTKCDAVVATLNSDLNPDDCYFPSYEDLENRIYPEAPAEKRETDNKQSMQGKKLKTLTLLKRLNAAKGEPKIRVPSIDGVIDLTEDDDAKGTKTLDVWLKTKMGIKKEPPGGEKKDLRVGVISMERNENGEESLKRSVLTVASAPNESAVTELKVQKPGASLVRVKRSLEESMAKKRREAWLQRNQQYKEEMGEDLNEEPEEEEEEVRDDDRSSHYSSEDSEADANEEQEDESDGDGIVIKKNHPFEDVEAVESDRNEPDNSDGDDTKLHLELTGVPETMEEDGVCISNGNKTPGISDGKTLLVETSLKSNVDMFGESMESEVDLLDRKDSFPAPTWDDETAQDVTKQADDLRILSFPMENTQDLMGWENYGNTSGETDEADRSRHFQIPDTLSQLEKSLNGFPDDKSQAMPDELLVLCSGTFPESASQSAAVEESGDATKMLPDEDARDGFESDMDDDDDLNRQPRKATQSQILSSDDEDEVPLKDDLGLSNGEISDEEDGEKTNAEEEEDEDDYSRNSSDDEVAVVRKLEEVEKKNKKMGMRDREGKLRKEFLEREAELSGSDRGSDDEEVGSEDDMMEAEEGDLDILPSETKLRQQVGKFFMKQERDDDDRRLLLYQEKFIDDNEESGMRKFRWRRQGGEDEELEAELMKKREFAGPSDVAEDEEIEMWAKHRMERTKWQLSLEESKTNLDEESLSDVEDPDSQILKFGKLAVRKSSAPVEGQSHPASLSSLINNRSVSVPSGSGIEAKIFPMLRQGSLLNRDTAALVSAAKAALSGAAVVDTRKGVFTRISPTKKVNQSKRKNTASSAVVTSEAAKKPKIVMNEDSNSVFEMFEL